MHDPLQITAAKEAAAPREDDGGSQASNLNIVHSEDIGQNGVLARRDLVRKVHGLGDLEVASFDGAFKIDVSNLLAEIGLGADESDEAVFDRQKNIGALINLLLDASLGLDNELLSSLWGVGRKVDLVNLDEVSRVISRAELERRVSGNLEVVVHDNAGSLAIENAQGRGRR